MRSIALIFLGLGSTLARAECPVLSFGQTIQQAETALINDELEEARSLVAQALEWMPCAREQLDPSLVSGLWQISAAVAYFGTSEEAALADLDRAKAIPGTSFRERLGGDLYRLWQQSNPVLDATLLLSPLPPPHLFTVDGAQRHQSEISLTAGVHLVQVLKGKEVVFQRVVDLNSGQRAELDTGLAEVATTRTKGVFEPKPFVLGGVVGTVAGLGLYGLAIQKDNEMKRANTADAVQQLRNESIGLRNAALGAGVLGAASLSLHFIF
jgi:hypothetical protein